VTDAEQKVRAVWRDVDSACIYGFEDRCQFQHSGNWPAALAFTEERLEEIRQLREEVRLHREGVDYLFSIIKGRLEAVCARLVSMQVTDVRTLCADSRTLLRLESILAEKTAGMKDTSPVRSTT
jgi:hypothetical protein